MHLIVMGLLMWSPSLQAQQNTKLAQDKAAIKSLAGFYKVHFQFAETFADAPSYQYRDRKFDSAIEQVILIEETDRKLSFQHLLMVHDSMIIKHWRQDWVYEDSNLLVYDKDRVWKRQNIPHEKVKGTWTQKVYQVDDAPRYQGIGTWIHADGKHYWESVADAPLPRREHTTRDDYNVMRRHSRIEITPQGWVLKQENEKIRRGEKGDERLCWERGIESFIRLPGHSAIALAWWNDRKLFWAEVRQLWQAEIDKLEMAKVNTLFIDPLVFPALQEVEEKFLSSNPRSGSALSPEIRKTLSQHTEPGA